MVRLCMKVLKYFDYLKRLALDIEIGLLIFKGDGNFLSVIEPYFV